MACIIGEIAKSRCVSYFSTVPKDCGEAMEKVERLAWNFDPKTKGYEWNEIDCNDYQRHFPEVIGYEVLRAIRKIKN